jgi:hypothetical protein
MTPPFNHDSIAIVPDDPDVRDVAEYVAGVMTDAQAEAFETRLAVDDALFRRVGPFLEAWVSPHVLPAEVEIGKAIERDRAVARRRTRTMHVAGYLTAAAALIGLVQVGVVEFASLERADSTRTLVQAPVRQHDPSTGAQPSERQPQTPKTIVTGGPRKPAATHPKQVAVVKPTPVDPATERAVAAWAAAPVSAVVTSSVPVGEMPVPPVVPAPVYTPQIDSATVPGQGTQVVSGVPEPTGSRWPTWLPHLPHIPRIPWPPHRLIGRR